MFTGVASAWKLQNINSILDNLTLNTLILKMISSSSYWKFSPDNAKSQNEAFVVRQETVVWPIQWWLFKFCPSWSSTPVWVCPAASSVSASSTVERFLPALLVNSWVVEVLVPHVVMVVILWDSSTFNKSTVIIPMLLQTSISFHHTVPLKGNVALARHFCEGDMDCLIELRASHVGSTVLKLWVLDRVCVAFSSLISVYLCLHTEIKKFEGYIN